MSNIQHSLPCEVLGEGYQPEMKLGGGCTTLGPYGVENSLKWCFLSVAFILQFQIQS